MAGTPTPNYNFPTYAETDVPDLAGAYNQAVNAIDAKIKEVADTIPSDVDVPDANSTTKGIAKLYDSTTVGSSTQDDGGITPKAVKDYVDAKVPTEQQAYTGTAPIVVDNGTHAIGITRGEEFQSSNIDAFIAKSTTERDAELTPVFSIADKTAYDKIVANNNAEHDWPAGYTAPTCSVVSQAIATATPDASTSVKGLVQLTDTPSSADSTLAVTGKGVTTLFTNRGTLSKTPVTVDLLKNLCYDTVTGIVYCKPSK